MATTAQIAISEYLQTTYDPDAEYIDGQVEERAVGDNDHSAWQNAICLWFQQQNKTAQIRVRP